MEKIKNVRENGSKNERNEREWKTEERMKKIENGKNEEHKREWKKAERIKESGIERQG